MDRIVTFPGLNISIHLNRIAFSVFGLKIYWYAIIIVSAMIIAILILKKRDGLYEIKFENVLDLLIILIPISLISARIFYVLFNLNFYLKNADEILNFRNGGMAIYGGIIGGMITCVFFCKKKKINLLDLMDFLAPTLVLGQAIGRWGNFVNIEAFGTQTNLPWRMGIYKLGKYFEVHPTFLYESLVCFGIFIALISIKNRRKFKGQITYLYLMMYSLERFFVEGLRTDSLMLGKIKVSQFLSIIFFIISLALYIINIAGKCRKTKDSSNKKSIK